MRAIVETVLVNDRRQNFVEAIQDIDPMIQVSTGKGPNARKCVKMRRKLWDGDGVRTRYKLRKIGRLFK